MFTCNGPPSRIPSDEMARFAETSEVVLTGKVLNVEPLGPRTLLARAIIEVDCIYKTPRVNVQNIITVEGVSTHITSCLSVVKNYSRYIFFLSSTSDDLKYNIDHQYEQKGALQLRKNTDLSAILEVSYQSSFQPHGRMCYQNCVEVSEWSEWGSCEASCGKSVMKRSLKPPPGIRVRRKHDCSKVEEKALCEVCPCEEPIRSSSNIYELEKPIETYFVHDGCQSTEVVRNKWCVGLCEDHNSENVPIRWGVETFRMICYDGRVVFYNVAIIQECGCVRQNVDVNDDDIINSLFGFS